MTDKELLPPAPGGDPNQGRLLQIPPGYEVVVDHGEPSREDESHLWDHVLLVWRRRWLVLAVFLLCFVPTALVCYYSRPVPMYESSARLRVGVDSPNVLPFRDDSNSRAQKDPIDTYVEILRSPSLAREVVTELNLFAAPLPGASAGAAVGKADGATSVLQTAAPLAPAAPARPSLFERFGIKYADLVSSFTAPAVRPTPVADPAAAAMQMRVASLLLGLRVMPIVGTQIIEMRYASPDPEISARVLNSLCQAYLRYDFSSKADAYAEARRWLQSKIEEMKGKLAESEDALFAFTGSSGKDFLALSDNAEEYYKQLDETKLRLAQVEDAYLSRKFELDQLKAGTPPDILMKQGEGARVAQLRSQLEGQQVEQARLTSTLGPRMRSVKEMDAANKQLEAQIDAEVARITRKAQLEFDRIAADRAKLQVSLDEQQKQVLGIQQRLSKYNILKREVDINSELLNNLLQKWKEIGLSQGLNASNVSILQAAVAPLAPLPTNRNRMLLVGAMLGLMLGLGLVFFLNYMDMSFHNADEIAGRMRLPILGSIAYVDFGKRRRDVQAELVAHQRPYSGYADSYRALRTLTQYAMGNGKARKVLVTSALPMEGKTTIATNLAITFAQKGRKVLVMDADLKNPNLHKVFGLKPDGGLTDLLTGRRPAEGASDGEYVQIQPTRVPNLFILTGGTRVPNPIDLLDSDAMRRLLTDLEQIYDIVVIDTAPVIEIADSTVLGPYVDGVLLVMQPGRTPRRLARDAKEKMMAMGARVLGVVVNYTTRGSQKRYGYGAGSPYYYARGQYLREGAYAGAAAEMPQAVSPPRFLLPPGAHR